MPFNDFEAKLIEDGCSPDDVNRMLDWMKEHEAEVKKADRVIFEIDTQFVSIVDHPAVTDSVLMFKSLRCKDVSKLQTKFISFIKGRPQTKDPNSYKKDSIFGAVLQPDITDGNAEIVPPWEVVKTAHKWMEEYQQIDTQHSFEETKDVVVESWVPEVETGWNMDNGQTKTYPAYTWFLIVKPTENTKRKVADGTFTGFSIAGKWAFMDTKTKQETVQDVSTMKANLEKALLDMIKTFEVETGVAVDYVTVDRGEWRDNETFESHIKKPITKIMLNALVKSRSSSEKERSQPKVKDMEPEEVTKIVNDALDARDAKRDTEQSQKNAEEEFTRMKEDLTSIKEAIEKLGKSTEESKKPEKKEDDEEEEEEEKKEDGDTEDEDEMEEEKKEDEDDEEEEEKKLKQKAETADPKSKKKQKKTVQTAEEEMEEYTKTYLTKKENQVKRLGLYKED